MIRSKIYVSGNCLETLEVLELRNTNYSSSCILMGENLVSEAPVAGQWAYIYSFFVLFTEEKLPKAKQQKIPFQ